MQKPLSPSEIFPGFVSGSSVHGQSFHFNGYSSVIQLVNALLKKKSQIIFS